MPWRSVPPVDCRDAVCPALPCRVGSARASKAASFEYVTDRFRIMRNYTVTRLRMSRRIFNRSLRWITTAAGVGTSDAIPRHERRSTRSVYNSRDFEEQVFPSTDITYPGDTMRRLLTSTSISPSCRTALRALASFLLVAVVVALGAPAASAQTGYTGIFGGGPFYKNAANNITEIENSGFHGSNRVECRSQRSGRLEFQW